MTLDPTNLQFSTDYNYQKIALNGTQNVSLTFNIEKITTIPHNLGYVPTARVWYEPTINYPYIASNQIYPLTGFQYLNTDGTIGLYTVGRAYLDATNLYVALIDVSGNKVIPIYYRIYYDA